MQISPVTRADVYQKGGTICRPAPVVDGRSDTVSLSAGGLRAALMESMGLDPATDSICISDIERVVERDTNHIARQLGSITSDMGIDAEFELSVGYDGSIVVKGDFPKRQALEERLNSDDAFARQFQRLSSNSCFLEAARESLAFQQAYAVDPEKAVQDFISLLDGNRSYSFRLHYSQDGVTTEVTAGMNFKRT